MSPTIKWTEDELRELKRLAEAGTSAREIALATERTKGSVTGKIRRMKKAGEIDEPRQTGDVPGLGKRDARYSDAVKELERLYTAAARLFKDTEALLAAYPVILIQTRGRARARTGSYWKGVWCVGGKRTSARYPELTLASEGVGRPAIKIVETLLHEMVHHYCAIKKYKDVSGSSDYHTKVFKREAEAIGLTVERQGRRGFAATDLSPELEKTVKKWKPSAKAFRLAFAPPRNAKAPTKLRKWTCGCGYGIRIAVDPDRVTLTCGTCGEDVGLAE